MPSPASMTPAWISCSLNFPMASSISRLGIMPASDCLSALTSTMNRIALSPCQLGPLPFRLPGTPRPLFIHTTNGPPPDRHGARFFSRRPLWWPTVKPRPTPKRAALRAAIPLVLLALGAPIAAPARAAKEDVVVLQNGDRVTGEVKWLTGGKLEYSTDDAGRLQIEWVKISRLSSPHSFEVETGSGLKYL